MDTKRCSRCQELKPLGHFRLNGFRDGKHRYRAACIECERAPVEAIGQSIPADSGCAQDYQRRLFDLAKRARKKPVSFEALCDDLNLSPRATRTLLEEAKDAGYPIDVEHGFLGIRTPPPRDDVQDTFIAPTVGERQRIAVISDTHFGSKYCLRGAVKDLVSYAYDQGVREILHCGDILDGDYRHGKFEMTHMGLTNQVRDLQKNLPRREGLTYHAITGNHDFTFTEESGVNVGRHIEDAFRSAGRTDFRCYGDRGAFLKVRGVLFHLWHPKASPGYAASYQLQRKVEAYSPGDKPQVLLVGHWHRFCYVEERSVHAIACPTFQGGGSAFGKSLTSGAPALGGLILEFSLTADGTLRDFSVLKRTYFQRETVYRVESADGIEI